MLACAGASVCVHVCVCAHACCCYFCILKVALNNWFRSFGMRNGSLLSSFMWLLWRCLCLVHTYIMFMYGRFTWSEATQCGWWDVKIQELVHSIWFMLGVTSWFKPYGMLMCNIFFDWLRNLQCAPQLRLMHESDGNKWSCHLHFDATVTQQCDLNLRQN